MKKRYLLLITAITVGSMLTLSGCNKKNVENDKAINKPSIQAHSNENEKIDIYSSDLLKTQYGDVEKVVQAGYEDIEEYLDEESTYKRFQGVALVAEGDEIKFAKAYGYADADDKRENQLTTRFAIASNTKQFTAAAIMQLVDKNKINLDDTIDKYIPQYKYGNQITVRALLQMRSGMPDYLNEIDLFMKDEDTLKLLKEYESNKYFDKYVEDKRWSADLILKNLYLTDLHFEPNTFFDYCNTNYYLLGLIIEQASGMTYEEYINENIFKPANMVTSSMQAEELDAKGHGSIESGEIVANPKFTFAAGNIYANVYDILRWNRMLHKGDILSKESYSEMITPVDDYGYGLFIREGIISHSGVIDGFNSYTEYDPSTDRTIIVMENMDKTTDMLDAKYDTSIIRQMMLN